MEVLLLDVALSGLLLGVLIFALGLLVIRLATPTTRPPRTRRRREPEPALSQM